MIDLQAIAGLGLLLLLGLKYHSGFHPLWGVLALACSSAGLALHLSSLALDPVQLHVAPLASSFLTMLLCLVLLRRRLPPWPSLHRRRFERLFRAVFSLQMLSLAGLLALGPPSGLLATLALVGLTVLGGALLLHENARLSWQRLGLVQLPQPVWAWLLTGLALYGLPQAWWLSLLIRVPPRYPRPQETLTPGQATLMLRLPLVTVNRCLERIPMDLQQRWFRPDPTRLHLREPLLETKNAPAYFAALAEYLHQRYRLGPHEQIWGEHQLVDFCFVYPDLCAQAILELSLPQAHPPPQGWTSTDLSSLRKPGKLTQLSHLLLLQRIVRTAGPRPN